MRISSRRRYLRFPVGEGSIFEHEPSLAPRFQLAAQFGEVAALLQLAAVAFQRRDAHVSRGVRHRFRVVGVRR